MRYKIYNYSQLNNLYEDYKNKENFLYRGQIDATWDLIPSIYRSKEGLNLSENNLRLLANKKYDKKQFDYFLLLNLRYLMKQEPNYEDKFKSISARDKDSVLWAFLQHIGIPTPYLDVTSSFTVALLFALFDWPDLQKSHTITDLLALMNISNNREIAFFIISKKIVEINCNPHHQIERMISQKAILWLPSDYITSFDGSNLKRVILMRNDGFKLLNILAKNPHEKLLIEEILKHLKDPPEQENIFCNFLKNKVRPAVIRAIEEKYDSKQIRDLLEEISYVKKPLTGFKKEGLICLGSYNRSE